MKLRTLKVSYYKTQWSVATVSWKRYYAYHKLIYDNLQLTKNWILIYLPTCKDVRVGPKLVQIGPKWEKSRTFKDQFQYILVLVAVHYWDRIWIFSFVFRKHFPLVAIPGYIILLSSIQETIFLTLLSSLKANVLFKVISVQ